MFGISFPNRLYLAGSLGSSVQMVMFVLLFGVLLILSPLYRCFITIRQIVCLGHLDLILIQFALVILGLILTQYSLARSFASDMCLLMGRPGLLVIHLGVSLVV